MLTRLAVPLVSASVVIALSVPAGADPGPSGGGFGKVQCDQDGGPKCHLEAGRKGSRGVSRPRSVAARGGRPLCPAPSTLPAGQRCAVFTGPGGGAAAPSPAALARRATADLVLPSPVIRSSPKPEELQLVTLPTWLWVDRSVWRAQSRSASAGGVSVTATARPTSVSWSTGDGGEVACAGPGTPYADTMPPGGPSPDCGHTYVRSSAGRPDESFPVRATITWAISWSGAGSGGTLPPLTSTAEAAFRVAESEALTRLAGA